MLARVGALTLAVALAESMPGWHAAERATALVDPAEEVVADA
jgi:hypothetical protein